MPAGSVLRLGGTQGKEKKIAPTRFTISSNLSLTKLIWTKVFAKCSVKAWAWLENGGHEMNRREKINIKWCYSTNMCSSIFCNSVGGKIRMWRRLHDLRGQRSCFYCHICYLQFSNSGKQTASILCITQSPQESNKMHNETGVCILTFLYVFSHLTSYHSRFHRGPVRFPLLGLEDRRYRQTITATLYRLFFFFFCGNSENTKLHKLRGE